MPTNYNSNITNPQATSGAGRRVAISSFSNAAPVVVQTVGVHGFNNNDSIEIEGTGLVDGLWVITGGSTTSSFSLNGSNAVGVGGSTGYAIDYEVLPALQLPSDGDLVQAVGIDPPFEGLIDTTAWHYRNAGKAKLYNQYDGPLTGATGFQASNTPYGSGGTPGPYAWGETTITNASWPSAGPRPIVRSFVSLSRLIGLAGLNALPVVGAHDFLDIEFTGAAACFGGLSAPSGYFVMPIFTQPIGGLATIVISSTSANGSSTPVTVTTVTNHGLSTGAYVDLTDPAGTLYPFLQGVWVITVTGLNTFTLNGSTTGASVPFLALNPGTASGLSQVIPLVSPTVIGGSPTYGAAVFIPTIGSSPPTPFPFAVRYNMDAFHSGLSLPGQVYIGLAATRLYATDSVDAYLWGSAYAAVNHYRPI